MRRREATESSRQRSLALVDHAARLWFRRRSDVKRDEVSVEQPWNQILRRVRQPLYPLPVGVFARSQPGTGEFALTSSWCIVVPDGASAQVGAAGEDLRSFLLEAGLGLRVLRHGERRRDNRHPPERGGGRASWRRVAASASGRMACSSEAPMTAASCRASSTSRVDEVPACANPHPCDVRRRPILRTRILRSPMSFFHRQELPTVLDAYPENYLLRMAHHASTDCGCVADCAKCEGPRVPGVRCALRTDSGRPQDSRQACGQVRDQSLPLLQ